MTQTWDILASYVPEMDRIHERVGVVYLVLYNTKTYKPVAIFTDALTRDEYLLGVSPKDKNELATLRYASHQDLGRIVRVNITYCGICDEVKVSSIFGTNTTYKISDFDRYLREHCPPVDRRIPGILDKKRTNCSLYQIFGTAALKVIRYRSHVTEGNTKFFIAISKRAETLRIKKITTDRLLLNDIIARRPYSLKIKEYMHKGKISGRILVVAIRRPLEYVFKAVEQKKGDDDWIRLNAETLWEEYKLEAFHKRMNMENSKPTIEQEIKILKETNDFCEKDCEWCWNVMLD